MCLYWVPINNYSSSQESKSVRPGRKKARMIEYAVKCLFAFLRNGQIYHRCYMLSNSIHKYKHRYAMSKSF